jgi:hypothetical protein
VVMEPRELVWRARHGSREAVRDREFVEWIDRFRYTSVELLAMRFGVAVQNVRVRLKRLEAGRVGAAGAAIDRRTVDCVVDAGGCEGDWASAEARAEGGAAPGARAGDRVAVRMSRRTRGTPELRC